jgi:hypothetical protein
MTDAFVPIDFDAPESFHGTGYRLEPLGAMHNDRDYDAWMTSIDHIHATPGFPDGSWPSPMSLEANLADLVRHAGDFESRKGFTYSILDGDDVIGCVYIYPSADPDHDAEVSSWVRESRAELDVVVWRELSAWMNESWPFANPKYDPRV